MLRRKTGLKPGKGLRSTPSTARTTRRIRRIRAVAEASGQDLSEWEGEFVGEGENGVATRVERYGKAFANPLLAGDGSGEAVLSVRQRVKVREIERKVYGKARRG